MSKVLQFSSFKTSPKQRKKKPNVEHHFCEAVQRWTITLSLLFHWPRGRHLSKRRRKDYYWVAQPLKNQQNKNAINRKGINKINAAKLIPIIVVYFLNKIQQNLQEKLHVNSFTEDQKINVLPLA